MKANQYSNSYGFIRRRPNVPLQSAAKPSSDRPQLSSHPQIPPRRAVVNDYPALRPSQNNVPADDAPEIDRDLQASLEALSDCDKPNKKLKRRKFDLRLS